MVEDVLLTMSTDKFSFEGRKREQKRMGRADIYIRRRGGRIALARAQLLGRSWSWLPEQNVPTSWLPQRMHASVVASGNGCKLHRNYLVWMSAFRGLLWA